VVIESLTSSSPTISLSGILLAVESLLVRAFARKEARGKYVRSITLESQILHHPIPLPMSVEQDLLLLPAQTPWEAMHDEYRTLGLYPAGHVMAMLRKHLDRCVLTSQEIQSLPDGASVTVAGLVVRRQRPLGKAVSINLEKIS
jgi:error-prone DNA polymerase